MRHDGIVDSLNHGTHPASNTFLTEPMLTSVQMALTKTNKKSCGATQPAGGMLKIDVIHNTVINRIHEMSVE